jgi:hypothetical protein
MISTDIRRRLTRPWMFKWLRRMCPGWEVSQYIRIYPGDMWLVFLLHGPWVQRFRKDQGRPGEIWNPRRWGGAILGLQIGCRG